MVDWIADDHGAVYDEETTALRDFCAERIDDFLHRDNAAVKYSTSVLELEVFFSGHVVKDVFTSVTVDTVGSDDCIRFHCRTVFEVEDQASSFRGFVFDVDKTLVEMSPPRRYKFDECIEEFGAVHCTLAGFAIWRYEHRTCQLAFRVTVADTEWGIGCLFLVRCVDVVTEQLESALSIPANANTGSDLTELVGGFVDLDIDVGVFTESKRQAKASDTTANNGEAEGAIRLFLSGGCKAGRRWSDGIACVDASMVVLGNGSHCWYCGRSSVDSCEELGTRLRIDAGLKIAIPGNSTASVRTDRVQYIFHLSVVAVTALCDLYL